MKASRKDLQSTPRWKPTSVVSAIACAMILISVSGCATSSEPELRPLDYCEVYQPVFDVDHPVVLENNAIYLKFCLGEGRDA